LKLLCLGLGRSDRCGGRLSYQPSPPIPPHLTLRFEKKLGKRVEITLHSFAKIVSHPGGPQEYQLYLVDKDTARGKRRAESQDWKSGTATNVSHVGGEFAWHTTNWTASPRAAQVSSTTPCVAWFTAQGRKWGTSPTPWATEICCVHEGAWGISRCVRWRKGL